MADEIESIKQQIEINENAINDKQKLVQDLKSQKKQWSSKDAPGDIEKHERVFYLANEAVPEKEVPNQWLIDLKQSSEKQNQLLNIKHRLKEQISKKAKDELAIGKLLIELKQWGENCDVPLTFEQVIGNNQDINIDLDEAKAFIKAAEWDAKTEAEKQMELEKIRIKMENKREYDRKRNKGLKQLNNELKAANDDLNAFKGLSISLNQKIKKLEQEKKENEAQLVEQKEQIVEQQEQIKQQFEELVQQKQQIVEQKEQLKQQPKPLPPKIQSIAEKLQKIEEKVEKKQQTKLKQLEQKLKDPKYIEQVKKDHKELYEKLQKKDPNGDIQKKFLETIVKKTKSQPTKQVKNVLTKIGEIKKMIGQFKTLDDFEHIWDQLDELYQSVADKMDSFNDGSESGDDSFIDNDLADDFGGLTV